MGMICRMISLKFPKFFQSILTWEHYLAPCLRILVIDGAEEFVRQQHGLHGSVVWCLEVHIAEKLLRQPACFVRFPKNLIVHLVPCLMFVARNKKPFGRLENTHGGLPKNLHPKGQN